MAKFTRSDDLEGAEFVDANLRGARFVGADLSGVVMRGVDVQGADIDGPWLAADPDGLRAAWAALERTWAGTLERVATMPAGTVDESVDGEWSRAGRVAMVRDFIATVTPEELVASRRNPHDPDYPETVLSCLHVILGEEWEHHRYAVRDLDALAAKAGA